MLIIQSFGFPPWCLTFPVHFFPVLNFFPHVPALFDLGPLFYLWDSILCLLLDVFMLAVCFLVGLLCFLSVHLYFSLSPLQCFYLLTEFYLQTLDIFVTSNVRPDLRDSTDHQGADSDARHRCKATSSRDSHSHQSNGSRMRGPSSGEAELL